MVVSWVVGIGPRVRPGSPLPGVARVGCAPALRSRPGNCRATQLSRRAGDHGQWVSGVRASHLRPRPGRGRARRLRLGDPLPARHPGEVPGAAGAPGRWCAERGRPLTGGWRLTAACGSRGTCLARRQRRRYLHRVVGRRASTAAAAQPLSR